MPSSLVVDRVHQGGAVLLSQGRSERDSCTWTTTINIALDGELEVQNEHSTVRGQVVVTPAGVRRLSRARGTVVTVLLDADVHRAAHFELSRTRSFAVGDPSMRAAAADLATDWGSVAMPAAEALARRLLPLGPAPLSDGRIEHAMERLRQGHLWVRPLHVLARDAHLSPGHFSELFSQVVGLPLKRWLLWQRLRHSLALLASQPILAGRAAFDAGFTDQPHMTRTYSALLGYTPGALASALPPASVQARRSPRR